MSAALLYRPTQRWQICVALAGAALIHLAAIAIAANRLPTLPPPIVGDNAMDIVIEPEPGDPSPPAESLEAPVPPPPPTSDDTFISEDNPTPPPVSKRPTRVVPPLVRSTNTGPAASTSMRAAKVLAISAPRPEYPYQARRERITGSGVALLTVNPAGQVTEVTILRSTGSAVLDNATISGFRRWRFKPGAVSKVQSPITFTLTGASY